MERFILWRGADEWRAEAARVVLSAGGVRASGAQLGGTPIPYRLDYELEAPEGFVTRSLRVSARGDGWSRRIDLRHDGHGTWTCGAVEEGRVELPSPGGDVEAVAGALDCDLGFSPLTNLMPVRRLGLHRGPGEGDVLTAWVSVPDLGLHASPQRYEHVGASADGAVVRFRAGAFTAELELDPDGLVVVYPGLAHRVGA